MKNDIKEFKNVFRNSYMIYTDLFQLNIVEDTYSSSKRADFMKNKNQGGRQKDNEDYCSECHKPFDTTFWFFKNSKD